MSGLIEDYRAFIIDLDGVVYLLNEPINGAVEAIACLQKWGAPFVFLTNNSVATPEQYVERLGRFGIKVEPWQVVTSSQALGKYLDLNYRVKGKSALAIGEDGLVRELESRGLRLVAAAEAGKVDFVFVGWDREFNFEKLKAAATAIRGGAEYIATNADATYPTPNGLWPGAGSMVAAVSTGSGREPFVAGKPNPLMVELALERMGVAPAGALMVGDRLDTDIKAGIEAGVDTALVLTGVSSSEEIERTGIRPTRVAESLSALVC